MAKLIDSLAFGGSSYVLSIPYAVCSTSASTAAKTVTASNWVETANLEAGARIVVKFSNSNTASSPTLNVNSTGAKSIVVNSNAITMTQHWSAGSVVEFVYDGTYWQMLGAPDSTYNGTITLSAGTGLSGGGDFTTNQSTAETISFALAASGVTAGTYGPSANVTGSNGTTINVPQITVDTYGRVTGVTNRTYTSVNSDTDTHYTTKLFATSSGGTAHAATTNGNTYLRLFDDSTARQSIKITGSGATSVTSDANGVITISSTDNNTNTSHSHSAGTGLTISGSGGTSGTTTYSANLNSTTSLGTLGTTNKLYAVGVDANGKLCVNVPWTDTDTNTHYTTKLFATSSTGTAHAATTNGNTYLRLFDDNTARQSIKITGSGATTVTSDANGVITISSTATNTDPAVSNSAPTLAWGTTSTVGTVGGTALTVKMPSNPNTDTYGRSGNTSSKIYLIGTTTQSTSNQTTYSHDTAYVGTDGCLYSGGTKVLTAHQSVSNSAPTLAWGTTSTVGTIGGTALTVKMPANPDTNTYGRNENTTSKIYLMGGTTQSASNKTTYSNVNCYASGGYLYSGGTKVSVEGHTHTFTDTNTAHSHTAGTGLTISGSGGTSGTTTYSANLNSTTSLGTIGTTSKLYAVGVDDNGKLCVNVPWTDTNTDTKVTQAADTTATTTLPVLLGYTSGTTATTQTVKKNSAQLNFAPGATYGTLTVKGDIIAGGGNDSYGVHPDRDNYSTLGKADKKWYKVYTSSIYVDTIYKTDGSTFSLPATITWNTF